VTAGAFAVGGVDGDIQTGVAHGVVAAGETPAVAHLGPDHRGGEGSDAIVIGLECPAGRLAAGDGSDRRAQLDQFGGESVDLAHPDLDSPPGSGREVGVDETMATGVAQQGHAESGDTEVEQRCLHALHPSGALIEQVFVEPHRRSSLKHVRRRDPRLGQATVQQELAEVTGVGSVRLGPLLLASQRRRLRRLRDVGLDPSPIQFADDIPPSRAPLQREGHISAALEARRPPTQMRSVRRNDPPRADLTSVHVEIVEHELSSMHIQTTNDRHAVLLSDRGRLRAPHAILVILPRRDLRSDSCSLGVIPAQLHRCRADGKRVTSPISTWPVGPNISA
jgi:hypothetical protein